MKLHFLYLVFTVFFCCTLANATSLVPNICKVLSRQDPKNINYEFCTSQLGSDPQSSKAMAPELATIAYQLAETKAKAIITTIDMVSKLPTVEDTPTMTALDNCSVLYMQIPYDLEKGLNATQKGDFSGADVKVSAAMNASTACGNKINEDKNVSLLAKENSEFYRLAAIIHGFMKLLPIINN